MNDTKKINEIIVCDLEYSSNPIKKMHNLNKLIDSDGKVFIVGSNIFWNPLFKFLELLNLKFKHPRKNLISSNFIENLCFLTDFQLIKKKRILFFLFDIFFLSNFFKNIIAKYH